MSARTMAVILFTDSLLTTGSLLLLSRLSTNWFWVSFYSPQWIRRTNRSKIKFDARHSCALCKQPRENTRGFVWLFVEFRPWASEVGSFFFALHLVFPFGSCGRYNISSCDISSYCETENTLEMMRNLVDEVVDKWKSRQRNAISDEFARERV